MTTFPPQRINDTIWPAIYESYDLDSLLAVVSSGVDLLQNNIIEYVSRERIIKAMLLRVFSLFLGSKLTSNSSSMGICFSCHCC